MVNLEMKNLSVFLAILLMILMYYTPPSLKDLANSFLGKLFLLIILSKWRIKLTQESLNFALFNCKIIF